MPTIELRFNLPEEQDECRIAFDAQKYKNTLFRFDQGLRSQLKYTDLSEEATTIYQTVRDKLWEIAQEEGLADLIE